MTSGAELHAVSATQDGSLQYVEQIRRKVLCDERYFLYAGHNVQGLLRFLTSGRRAHSSDSPSATTREVIVPDPFVWILELEPDTATNLPRNIPNPNFLNSDCLSRPSANPHGDLFILRGYPSPEWLARLGSHCSIEVEFWRQHLDFLEPSSSDTFSYPALPSSSCEILQLRLTTIGTRARLSHNDDHAVVRQLRGDAKHAMSQYRDNLRVGSGWRTGDSIVRDYTVYDTNHFCIDQRITICLNKVDRRENYWQALIFTDCGEDLAASPHGPWLGDANTRTIDRWTTLIPLHRYVRDDPAIHDQFLDHEHDQDEDYAPGYGFRQNSGQMHIDYGRTLNHRVMCSHPLYAMSDVFALLAVAEAKFLNMLSQKLARDSKNVITDNKEVEGMVDARSVYSQENLVHSRQVLEDHINDLKDILSFFRRQRELNLWSSLELSESDSNIYDSAVLEFDHDFQHLLHKAESLHRLCESAMVIAMNSASIAEARRGLTQARNVFKFTVLASVYVPFSFTSSFMGMNVTEINEGSKRGIWMFFAITAPVVAISALFLFADWRMMYARLKRIRRHRRGH